MNAKDRKNVKKILVVSAHPDDSDFGCGGTAALFARQGKEITLCAITNGNKGVCHSGLSIKEIVPVRKREQKASANILRIKKVIFLDVPDGELENTKAVRKKIVKVIREEKPDVVMSFDPGNKTFDNFYRFHRDHRVAAEAVFDAVYPEAGCDVFFPELVKKGFAPHTIKAMWCFSTDRPSFFVDISNTIDKKVEALQQHKSQIVRMEELSSRMRDHAKKTAKQSKKKMKYAEAFRIISF